MTRPSPVSELEEMGSRQHHSDSSRTNGKI
ncbi:MAG: hypothetical protein RL239_701, partial [Actinomycetota bacterium]